MGDAPCSLAHRAMFTSKRQLRVGNTADAVLRQIECPIVAVKPDNLFRVQRYDVASSLPVLPEELTAAAITADVDEWAAVRGKDR